MSTDSWISDGNTYLVRKHATAMVVAVSFICIAHAGLEYHSITTVLNIFLLFLFGSGLRVSIVTN